MSTPFSRSMRSLEADGFHHSMLGLLVGLGLLAMWAAWCVLADVPVYEVTDDARLEVDRAMHPIQSRVAGRIVEVRLAIGQDVRAGDVLVELDATRQRLDLDEERSRRSALAAERDRVQREIEAETRALADERRASEVALDQARAQTTQAQAAASFADTEAERIGRLRTEGLVNELEFLRADAEARKGRAGAEAARLAVTRLEKEQQSRESDRRARIERLRSDVTRLDGRIATTEATMKGLEYEIEERQIKAPVPGQLAEAADLRVGGMIGDGYRVGTVVPPGRLRAVAHFAPADALGRVRRGQAARLRLVGFPWAQYGVIPARVTRVSGEIRSERVRVELEILAPSVSAIPFQHGLPGSIEVEVERVTPATLVLRSAGRLLRTTVIEPSTTPRTTGP